MLPRHTDDAPAPERVRSRALWAVAPALAFALRLLWLLRMPAVAVDGDEAVGGVMAQRILEGGQYVFFAGQDYMGSLQQYATAVVLAVLPDTYVTLRLVDVALAAGICLVVQLVAFEVTRSRWRAAVAGILFAIGPFWSLYKGVRAYGAYGLAELCGVLGLWCALVAVRRIRAGGEDRRALAAAACFGLCCGLALWSTFAGLYLLVGAGILLLPHLLRSWRLLAAAVTGAVVGLAPVAFWVVRHHRRPFSVGPQPPTTAVERFRLFAGPVLREYVGAAGFAGRPTVWPWLATALVLVLVAVVVLLVVRRWRGLLGLATLRPRHVRPLDAVLVGVPVTVLMNVTSPYTWYVGTPRYVVTAFPLLPLLLVAVLPRRAAAAQALAVVLVVGTAALTVQTIRVEGSNDAGVPPERALRAVMRGLDERGERHAWASFNIAHPIEYLDGLDGPLQVAAITDQKRLVDVTAAVKAAPDPVFIVAPGPDLELLETQLRAKGITWSTWSIEGLVVYDHLSGKLDL